MRFVQTFLIVMLLLGVFAPIRSMEALTMDQALPGGWWYSQTGVPGEAGFPLVDDAGAQFWSEFRRLGGVDALGYPVSQRFQLDGFTVQATQRVLMQWRPESNSVMFVNVFDRLHDLGQDAALRRLLLRRRGQPRLPGIPPHHPRQCTWQQRTAMRTRRPPHHHRNGGALCQHQPLGAGVG